MSEDTMVDGPPLDHEPVTKPPNSLGNALVAGAVALTACAALYIEPWLVLAFAAGVIAALWFRPAVREPDDDRT